MPVVLATNIDVPMLRRGAFDELRAEYHRDELRGGVRGKYLAQYRKGTNLALLAPDVRAAFPTDESVNEALRSIMDDVAAAP